PIPQCRIRCPCRGWKENLPGVCLPPRHRSDRCSYRRRVVERQCASCRFGRLSSSAYTFRLLPPPEYGQAKTGSHRYSPSRDARSSPWLTPPFQVSCVSGCANLPAIDNRLCNRGLPRPPPQFRVSFRDQMAEAREAEESRPVQTACAHHNCECPRDFVSDARDVPS